MMQWFKHSSDARNSLKLRKVRRKFGADGYAIYWFCLEAIAQDVDKDNLTFNLKEDAETIGFELSVQEKRVNEIMLYMIEIGLFESSNNMITCLKLAERLDKSMTNSPKMRAWLGDNSADRVSQSVMTLSDSVSTCAELDKNRLDKNRKEEMTLKESNKSPAVKKSKFCPVHFASSEYQGYELNLESWTEWCEFRKDGKKPIIKTTAVKQLKLLVNYSIDEQKGIIDRSIIGQYQGLFPFKNQTQPRYASNQTNSFDLDSDDFMNEQSFSEKYGVQK